MYMHVYIYIFIYSTFLDTATQLPAGAPSLRSLLSLCPLKMIAHGPCYPAALTDGKTVLVSAFSAVVCCYAPFVPFGVTALVGLIT
jgi:hypothetical protein